MKNSIDHGESHNTFTKLDSKTIALTLFLALTTPVNTQAEVLTQDTQQQVTTIIDYSNPHNLEKLQDQYDSIIKRIGELRTQRKQYEEKLEGYEYNKQQLLDELEELKDESNERYRSIPSEISTRKYPQFKSEASNQINYSYQKLILSLSMTPDYGFPAIVHNQVDDKPAEETKVNNSLQLGEVMSYLEKKFYIEADIQKVDNNIARFERRLRLVTEKYNPLLSKKVKYWQILWDQKKSTQ